MKIKQTTFLTLLVLLSLSSCTFSSGNSSTGDFKCGLEHKKIIKKTQGKIIQSSPTRFPDNPYSKNILSGCVGIEFNISKNGEPYELQIIESSEPKFFERSALATLRKYRFEQSDEDFVGAYLVLEYALK